VKGIQVCSNEGDVPSSSESKNTLKIFKNIFFSRTIWPNSIKHGTIYPWIKGNQVCSNKESGPLQRGDNHKNVKIGWGHLKIFSRTTGPILTRLGKNYP
jgi:hypothetical protein